MSHLCEGIRCRNLQYQLERVDQKYVYIFSSFKFSQYCCRNISQRKDAATSKGLLTVQIKNRGHSVVSAKVDTELKYLCLPMRKKKQTYCAVAILSYNTLTSNVKRIILRCPLIHSERAVAYQNNRMRNFLSNLFCVFVLCCNLGTRQACVVQ